MGKGGNILMNMSHDESERVVGASVLGGSIVRNVICTECTAYQPTPVSVECWWRTLPQISPRGEQNHQN